jgi:ribosome-binding factor A
LLKEVISDVIRTHVKNPSLSGIITVTRVEITKDLHYAKVYISVLGTDEQKKETMEALRSAAGFIAVTASKMVVMRYFPELHFIFDDSVEKQIRIETLLKEIRDERSSRITPEENP